MLCEIIAPDLVIIAVVLFALFLVLVGLRVIQKLRASRSRRRAKKRK